MVLVFAALFGLFVLAHTAPFPFVLDKLAPGPSVWRLAGRHASPTVYLTYDDGPNPGATPALLDVLAAAQTRATFFVIDRWVDDETAAIVRRAAAEGHGVALHSGDRWLMARSPAALAKELTATAGRIEALTGVRPCAAFRPHGGWRSGSMYKGLRQIDYSLVGWSWFAWDWNWFRGRTADSVVKRIVRRASDGLIVVIHDGHHRDARADRAYAVEATRRIVPALRARGFRFGTICEAIEPVVVKPAPPGE
jgi:peptidoglycan/xylan/chitin deacetylase (PgdA/CDA1 family)